MTYKFLAWALGLSEIKFSARNGYNRGHRVKSEMKVFLAPVVGVFVGWAIKEMGWWPPYGTEIIFLAIAAWVMYSAFQSRIDSITVVLKQIVEKLEAQPQDHPEPAAETTCNEESTFEAELVKSVLNADRPRYCTIDGYTKAELERFYDREDSKGRIRLLRRIYSQRNVLPFELALKAVTDDDPAVREWMAREASGLKYPEENLRERISNDPDPFIRAVLFENSNLSDFWIRESLWVSEFLKCVPLQRLAMMRNKKLNLELVEHILDLDDTSLNLEFKERSDLACACLENPNVIETARRGKMNDFEDGSGWYQACKHSKAIWELAAKWPDESGIQYLAFRYVQTDDKVKSDIYQKCQVARVRCIILESCLPFEDRETIILGRGDNDPYTRYVAYYRSRSMNKQEINAVLQREKDEWSLSGLLRNPWVGATARELQKAMSAEPTAVAPIAPVAPETV
jgi:hypothetical protein